MTSAPERLLDVLLVEDNQADVLLTEEAIALSGHPVRLRFARDGQDALEQLRQRGHAPPCLILLDLNMPRLDGLQTLAQLKQDPLLTRVPVVMLTTSARAEDIDRAYALGVNAFVTKPVVLDEFLVVMDDLLRFWLKRVALPSRLEV